MSTRGFVTFVIGGTEKTAYNHNDSYPDGLGLTMLDWLRGAVTDEASLREKATALRTIDGETLPTAADIEQLRPWANLQVSTRSLDDWYCLLRETQGRPGAMLDAGVIEDGSEFPRDSLFAEWGYVADLDARTLEVYEGFQHSPHKAGRFADRPPATAGYYPVALVASWPFDSLPDDAAFVAALEEAEDSE